MRPGGKSNGVSPFFETPNLSFEGRVRNVATAPLAQGTRDRPRGGRGRRDAADRAIREATEVYGKRRRPRAPRALEPVAGRKPAV